MKIILQFIKLIEIKFNLTKLKREFVCNGILDGTGFHIIIFTPFYIKLIIRFFFKEVYFC